MPVTTRVLNFTVIYISGFFEHGNGLISRMKAFAFLFDISCQKKTFLPRLYLEIFFS
jgi:hypothetical protein